MTRIDLTAPQHAQMTALLGQLSTTRTVAEAFVGYFAKELGVNLQLYQFNADSLSFEPVGGYTPATADDGLLTPEAEDAAMSAVSSQQSRNGVP